MDERILGLIFLPMSFYAMATGFLCGYPSVAAFGLVAYVAWLRMFNTDCDYFERYQVGRS